MAICEPRVSESSAHGKRSASSEALIKLRDIAGKSSRSVVTTATVPTDISECGEDDNSVVLFVETVDDSSDDESCRCGTEKNSATQPPIHAPPVQTVDLLTGDLFDDSTSKSVESDFDEDVVQKPRSLPSVLDLSKKNGAKNRDSVNIDTSSRKIRNDKVVTPIKTELQTGPTKIPENLRKAMRARRAAIRKWHSAPELGPQRTVYDLYVPPHQSPAAVQKKKRKKKKKRERKTVAGAVGGMVAGAIIGGPIGVVLGAAVGGLCSRQAAKKVEKRSQRKREQQSFRDYAMSRGLQWELNGDAAVFC